MLYGFWLSMDFPEISVTETLTLLSAYGGRVNFYYRKGRLLIVDVDLPINVVKHIIYRSATIKEGFRIYDHGVDVSFKDVVTPELIEDVKDTRSLAIKVLMDRPSLYEGWDNTDVAKLVAEYVLREYRGSVDLNNPERRFVFIFVGDNVFSALELVGKHSKGFRKRMPGKRPVFSPFSLHPKLARTMVNLSGAVEGDIILDPFCGVGGISIESSMMGIGNICVEIIYRWASGCRENVIWVDPQYRFSDVICGDSLKTLVKNVRYVVTDPPYGRITSIGGYEHSRSLINHFLEYLSSLDRLMRAVFMVPSDFKLEFDKYDLREINRFEIPVHSGLTRVLRIVGRD